MNERNERPARPNKDHKNYHERAEQYMDWADTEIKDRIVRNQRLAYRLNDADRRIVDLKAEVLPVLRDAYMQLAVRVRGPNGVKSRLFTMIGKMEATDEPN